METIPVRLKRLRESAEPKITIRAMGEALQMVPSTYAAYEDPKKFKKPILPLDLAQKIAAVLEPRNVSRVEVLKLAGLEGSVSSTPAPATGKEYINVIGKVEAGVWRESFEWPVEEQYPIEVGPSPWPGARRGALVVEGYSMDKIFQPGTELEFLYLLFNDVGLRAQPGDLVIVQRRTNDLVETTCKRLAIAGDGSFELRAESTRPEFQEPIPIGRPDADSFSDDSIEIMGIVSASHMNHFRRK